MPTHRRTSEHLRPTACTLRYRFEGDHNSQRPQIFYNTAAAFISKDLDPSLATDAPDVASRSR
jgi:hypothetical protein